MALLRVTISSSLRPDAAASTHLSIARLLQKRDLETPPRCQTDIKESELGLDTEYMRTYTVLINVTLSIDEQLVARARKKAAALGKSLNQLIRDYLQKLAGGDDPEQSIEEFKRLSGRGHSRGWRFNRNEIHERS
jgi:hypothetical protein